jgi:hypoxia up-regulated 1
VREEVLNSLEAFTYRARDHLEDEAFIAVSTAEVRSTLESLLSATSDWIYSEGGDAPQDILKAKLKALEDIVKPILKRKTEAVDRPAAIQKFESNIADMNNVAGIIKKQLQEQEVASSKSSEAVSKASVANAASPSPSRDSLDELEDEDPSASETPADPEITPVPTIYTDEDLKAIEEAYKEAKTWLEEKQAAQSKLKDTDEPALTSEDVKVQSSKLEQAIVRMMTKKANVLNQPKAQKPKAKPKKKPAKKDKKKPAKKDSKADEPSQEELDEALKKAGIKGEGVKLKNFGAGKDGKVTDKDGNLLTKLELGEDATEEEIMAAIEKATEEGRKARESKGSDEL